MTRKKGTKASLENALKEFKEIDLASLNEKSLKLNEYKKTLIKRQNHFIPALKAINYL